ncbi:MAG: ATP-binding protein [Pirellulales bacterium]|nr:ATP-binding protein [Pirellulales bacterium]
MRTIFDTCVPRDEVLSGELRDQQFAASLTRVLRGGADEVYGDAATFFSNTFPTGGLKSLLREGLGRLTGANASSPSVIRLETSFGGGKTHNLIALYHLCRGTVDASIAKRFVSPELVPATPIKKIAGIVGPDMEVADGVDHDGLRTYTMWGELAWQLGFHSGGAKGARDAYEVVRKSDEQRTAPGTQAWEKLIGDDPALLMIDEIAYYLRVARGAQFQAGKTSVAEQTVAFLMSLIKFASESKRTVLVYTLADSSDAFGTESDELREELAEARSISARQEHVLTPTAEDEISAIVTHRLFQNVDRKAAEETAKAWTTYYSRVIEQGVDLPQRAVRAEYQTEIVQDHPFHPELLTTLNRKTSTIPNFQKTRGVLRLLAQTVRELWRTKPRDCYLICPHHLDLGQEQLANDLTSRLDRPQFKQVIEADIASPKKGTLSHAQEIDLEWTEAGRPPYAQRVAATTFLHSLVQTGQSGTDPADLRLAVLQPDDDPALIDKAIQRLIDRCWFFDYDGLRYRFKTEPSLRKIVDDEMGLVGKIKAKSELDDRIQKVWKKGVLHPEYFPAEAADVDDDAQAPKLVVLHYDAAAVKATEAGTPPDLVLKLFEHKGSMEEYRTYKNNLVFLVADADQVDRMVDVAQQYLATRRITGDPERMQEFNKAQAEKLKQMGEAAELDLRVAITKCYRHLYYPSADAPRKNGNLAHQALQAEEQGKVQHDQAEVILKALKNLEKVLTADDKPLNAQYVKAKAWPANTASMSTEDLRREFCKRLGLKMLLDINQLKKTIREGVQKGAWVYYVASEGYGYGEPSPSPMVEISEDATLYTLEESQRVGIKIKGAEQEVQVCPVCNNVPCTCDQDDDSGKENGKPTRLSGEGTPSQAFQAVSDQCHDHGIQSLKRLFIRVEGMGKDAARDLRSLGLAIPQMGKAGFQLDQRLILEFEGGEKFQAEFIGSWDRYKRIKSITDQLSQEASNASVKMTVRAEFEGNLAVVSDQFQTIRDVLESLSMGKVYVDAQPAAEKAGEGAPA